MKRIFFFLTCTLFALTACANTENITNTDNEGITHTRSEEPLSDEELISNSRNEVILNVENRHYSKEEAASLVKNHLNLKDHDKTQLSFEGMHNGEYVFHVTDLVHFTNQPQQLSKGWYRVNQASGKVTKWDEQKRQER